MRFEQNTYLLTTRDSQNVPRAGFYADAAGNALGYLFGGVDHDLHRAGLGALAAAHAELLVDHVHALGVLGDGALLADLGALAALGTCLDVDDAGILQPHADAGLFLVVHLIISGGAGVHALVARVALGRVLDLDLFH